MTGNDNAIQDTKQKLGFYFESKRKIHLSCSGGIFYNGVIYDLNTNKDFIIFDDMRLGHIPVMFEEISRINPFKEVGE